MRFLIDECLTPTLVGEAHRLGHEAYHVAHIGQARSEDRSIAAYAQANDLILTTNNAADFRRLYARQELHPGLLLIIPSVERETQIRLFQAALAKLAEIGEPVNQIIEAHLDGNGIRLEQFEWPTSPG